MPNRYHQIQLAAARPGMTLSDAVLDTKGNVLLPKGTQLSEAMLASLLRHQIDTVVIAGIEVSAEEDTALRNQCVARLDFLFRQPGKVELAAEITSAQQDSAATATLHRYILNFRSSMPS